VALVCIGEIVELLILMLIVDIHEAVRFVHHVLLATARVAEHLIAEETKVAELDTLSDVGKQALQRGHAINIQQVERVLHTHVVEALLDS
jgi:hypothetical protein